MHDKIQPARRKLVLSMAAGGVGLAPWRGLFAAEEIYKWSLAGVTPATVAGPFYPLQNKPLAAGADLATVEPGGARARGQLLYVAGRVLNVKGVPARDVEVEIWQANGAGRYSHPSDPNTAPLDPNFKGYGVVRTDAEGRYRFRTIVPAGYPVIPGWDRAPHIHFQLTGRRDRAVTQMWLPDHPLNAQDRLFTNLPPPARAMVTARLEDPAGDMEPEAKIARFDIIVANG